LFDIQKTEVRKAELGNTPEHWKLLSSLLIIQGFSEPRKMFNSILLGISAMRSTSFELSGVKIEVVQGDITEMKVDAIVNPANTYLIMGGGVAGAIKRKGGREIEEEAVKKGPIQVGAAVFTSAGRLSCKYVIHAPTVEEPGGSSSLENVAKATKAALKTAESLKISSIAFPGMGTGVGGLDVRSAIATMMREVKNHVLEGTNLKEIFLVAFRSDDYVEFVKGVGEVLATG
jgi:O-acetyl-ADP-ribose deacetylase (regulator of RNase III)